ncbi:2'-5'-oligoadenylate synthase 1A-like isoform X2 [Protopterus annectens]|uniref:2'-5'-oligoadenylate synthase 1A-like isoform X2 n=1 Tax=Protopterus annectens TaxID=7888 RepID=UPI001CF934CC|nr:2'-5'-oligoadenylate synthase 1A-like isoform X2 [Protopterus annectens]
MELYNTSPKQLDTFIMEYLQPNEAFLSQVKHAINLICNFLKENCFKNSDSKIKVLKIVKGGSSAKGTALRNGSDADLVVFLNCFNSYEQQKAERRDVINEIKDMLKKCDETNSFEVSIYENRWPNPRSISFDLQSRHLPDSIEFDILPAYDALGHLTFEKPDPKIYVKLLEEYQDPGEYSVCFTELQRDFIRERPTKVKSLIRLVKYWYKKHIEPQKKMKLQPGQRLPPKYALELLVVYVWENGSGGATDFKMADAFYSFLKMVCEYKMICIYWTKYYDFQNEILKRHLRSLLAGDRPIILDPADPTGNVAAGNGWKLLADEAKVCLEKIYGFMDTVQWDVPPFKSILLTVKLEKENLFQSSESPAITIKQIKEIIYQCSRIPVSQQCLIIEDDPETGELMDSKQLLDYGIFWDASVCVVKPQPTHILVKNHVGRTTTYKVTLKDTVLQLKTKIEKLEKVPVAQQKLVFSGYLLEDTYTLEHYQIKEGSVIFLTLRLRGGR